MGLKLYPSKKYLIFLVNRNNIGLVLKGQDKEEQGDATRIRKVPRSL
jgi:hypothetical protein